MTRILIILFSCHLASWGWQGTARSPRRLWILRQPGEIVEYDTASFSARGSVKVPVLALKKPEGFSVNHRGQMLFAPGESSDEVATSPETGVKEIWFWDGAKAVQLSRGAVLKTGSAGTSRSVVESFPRCLLSADGQHLFWFENEFRKRQENTRDVDLSVTTVYRVWQTSPASGERRQIVEGSFSPCKCGTGVCSESCPEADLWAPKGGIDGFFLLTHWIPGQLGPTYQETLIYRKENDGWRGGKLAQPLESVLDAAPKGEVIVSALPDSACCGWDNESDDQTLAIRDGKREVIFDERERYANPDYDVSFYTSNAMLSPDSTQIAMTISSSSQPGSEIRLSSDGKPDAGELERIREAILNLPAVEVRRLGEPPRRTVMIPHASLAGWLSEGEILILQDQNLIAVEVASGTRRNTQIRVSRESYVFLR
jgi:hypothetical protein